jgi:branched-subunit amino acid aminotransferase/4-amino-4-deoxychorismate lyase
MREVPFDAPAVERGVGFFETILLIGHRASFFGEHVARLRGTVADLELPFPDEEQVFAEARSALEAGASRDAEAALRLSWIAIGHDLAARESWRLDASVRPIPQATLQRRAGSRCATLPRAFVRDTPGAKSTSYLGAVLGLRWAHRRGADEGLFASEDGSYLEGTATAVVAWDDGRLAWPARGVLPSVTASAFRRMVAAEGARRPLVKSDLAAGAVLLGGLTLACPLLSVDGEPCAQPPAMLEAIRVFNARVVADAAPIEP